MSYLKRQGGVTLVELVLVLAIAAGLITSAIAVRSSLRKDISFSTSIEQVKNQIVAAKNESIQTVKNGENGAGNSNSYDFGRAVEFFPTDDPATPGVDEKKNMRVSTLISELDDSPGDGLQQKMAQCDQRWELYKDGAEYKGTEKRAIIFQRKPERIFVTPLNHNSSGGAVCADLAAQLGSDTPTYGGYDSDNDTIPDTTDLCPYVPGPAPSGCPGGPPPPPPDACDSNGYTCGLYGRFYDRLAANITEVNSDSPSLNANLVSAFNGEQIGETYSVTSTWLPILRYRTKNPAERVSAKWTGQIRIPANTTRNICLNTDDGSYMTINGVQVTDNYTDFDQGAIRCKDFVAGSSDSWYDISIAYGQRDTIESTPFISLTYSENGGAAEFVPLTDLRTIPGTIKQPSSAYATGLRGEYFSNNSIAGSPYSVWTDGTVFTPLGIFIDTFTFASRTGNANTVWWGGFEGSVRWSGQINVTSANQRVCFNHAEHSGIFVNVAGTTVINSSGSGIWGADCAEVSPNLGWQNITIVYERKNTNGWEFGLRVYNESNWQLPQFRRSLDATSNTVEFKMSDNDNTNITVPPKNDCANLTNTNVISRNFANLPPSTNYKMDLLYSNYGASLPFFYSDYKFCVKVNGQFINGSNPIDFPAPTGGGNATKTINSIASNSSGNVNVELFWLNDAWTPPLDANFQLDKLDLYRTFDSTGNIVKNSSEKSDKSIVARILNKISGTAFAQVACGAAQTECSILNYDNYKLDSAGDFTFYPDEAEFEFGIDGSPETGKIKVDPQTNSITREIDL